MNEKAHLVLTISGGSSIDGVCELIYDLKKVFDAYGFKNVIIPSLDEMKEKELIAYDGFTEDEIVEIKFDKENK